MINYIKFGAPPYKFVLVHGFPCDHTVWHKLIPELSKVSGGIAIDMPGVGKSPAIPNLSLDLIADEILKVIDLEGMTDVHMIGHSMGGYTVFNAAQKTNVLKAITMVHSGANADNAARLINREKSIALMEKGEREKLVFLSAMFKNFFAPTFNASHPDVVKKYIEMGNDVPVAVLTDLYKAIMYRKNAFEYLKTTPVPIQYIIGMEDTATPPQDLLQQTMLPQIASVHVYEHCGHGSFEEMPERLASDIINFHKYSYEQ